MPWDYIRMLLGPGLLWNKPQDTFLDAIDRANEDGRPDAAQHIEIMLDLRNKALCEEKTPRSGQDAG